MKESPFSISDRVEGKPTSPFSASKEVEKRGQRREAPLKFKYTSFDS